MKVFVSGGNGFVGKHCCARLKALGFDVVAPSSKELDISKPFKFTQHFDQVIHLAAYNITSVGDKNEEMYTRVNVEGTRRVIEGAQCDQFIYLSTAKVYDEKKSAYAQSKVAAEEVCRQYYQGKNLAIIRSVNILGDGQAPKAVLPVFIEKAERGEPLVLTVDPGTPIAYIDVRDLVEVIIKTVGHPGGKKIYNAAYPDSVTLHELALKVIAACHSSSKITMTAVRQLVQEPSIDCQNTWDELKFQPRYDIDQILGSMIL